MSHGLIPPSPPPPPEFWTCPYCGHAATIREHDRDVAAHTVNIENALGGAKVFVQRSIRCPNDRCRRVTVTYSMHEPVPVGMHGAYEPGKLLQAWRLIPPAQMKILPPYVPRPIVEDYEEACKIAELSPKAAATLARRALQGMIRDFHKIAKPRLKDEVDALQGVVDPLVWKAIDAVRSTGNIGAHMEKDINVLVDVDPDEARLLIGLIEILVDDWYVARHRREESLNAVVDLGKAKQDQRAAGKQPKGPAAPPSP